MSDQKSTDVIRVAMIGTGWAGETALKHFRTQPNVEVVALADTVETRLNALGHTYGITHLYTDYEELLAQEQDLDAVSIAAPNFMHAPIVLAALRRGVHVLCEKPLARTSEEAATLVEAAREAKRILQVVFNHRERGDVQLLKQYIDEGNLGNIYYAKAYWMRRRGVPGAHSWFVNKELAGGGPLIDLGVHVLDMALFLLNEPSTVSVSASTYSELGRRGLGIDTNSIKFGTDNHFNVEDLATAFIRLQNGTTLLLETSWATHSSAQDDYGVVLYGTEGGAEIRVVNYTTENTLRIYTNIIGQPATIQPAVPPSTFHKAVIEEFIRRITSGDWSQYDGSDGLRRARIIDACYASALEGREVLLNVE